MAGELDEFHGEAREILDGIAGDLVRLEQTPKDADLVNRIFRGAHSLKGLAGMLGFAGISHAAHRVENALDGVRMGRIAVSAATLDVLLDGVEILGRMIDATRDGEPDREDLSWSAIEERLVELGKTQAPAAADGGRRRGIDPDVAKLLSEYEEHRLSDALGAGQKPWRLDVQLPFETFDTDLPALKERLKPYGEVITTMAGDLSAADKMGFGILVVSQKDPSVLLVVAAVPNAKIAPIAVVDVAPVPSMTPAPAGAAPTTPGAPLSGWGIADLPAQASAATLASTSIDWNALAQEGEAAPASPAPLVPRAPAAGRPSPIEVREPDGEERRTGSDRRSGVDRRAQPRDGGGERRAPAPEASASPVGASTLRVNLERVDALMNLVGELVTAKNAIAQVAERLKAEQGYKGMTLEVFKAKRTLERRLDELQKGIMQVRMLPLEQLFTRLTRVVRNLSRESGKEVELVVEGAETEIDKVMIDELSDPLIHIVRNAVDHGIEPLDVRLAASKPAKGTIRINASPKGNHVSIEIADDGGGLDAERIREKAIERGLLPPEADPPEDEIFDLIFSPGFSTKDVVSEVSGRGVGMDVVRNNIMKLNGIIDTRSVRGKGTTFTITLPLTLATMKALVVGVYSQTYAIPLASVLECVTTRADGIRTVEGREVLPLRETTLPLIRLDRFFRLRTDEEDAGEPSEEEAARRLQVVVVGLAQYRIGLVVDVLGAQQDVVVKPLGAPISGLRGIMGATNLGNNRAVLVLDVAGVVSGSVGARAAEGASS